MRAEHKKHPMGSAPWRSSNALPERSNMLKGANGRTQASTDHVVQAEAAKRRRGTALKEPRSHLPALISVALAVAAFSWWRRQRSRDSNGAAGSKPGRQSRKRATESSSLPRSATSNNKKNKERHRAEKERRAEKKKHEATHSGASGSNQEDRDNSVILTSTFVAPQKRSSTNIPKPAKREAPSSSPGTLDPVIARELKRK